MKLAKCLIIEDSDVALTLSVIYPKYGFIDWELTSKDGEPIAGRWLICKGAELPTGPLHPIAALAFAMAGFVLVDNDRTEYRWIQHTETLAGWESTDRDYQYPTPSARIHSHTDPTLTDNGHNG